MFGFKKKRPEAPPPQVDEFEPPHAPSAVNVLPDSELNPPSPSEKLLFDKPYEVEVVRLPGDDSKRDLEVSLESAYTLIKSGNFDQAGMLYDIIDPEFKKYQSEFSGDQRSKLLKIYNEVTLYLWVQEAYILAQKRHIKQLSNLVIMIDQLLKEVSKETPLSHKAFLSAKSKLAFVHSVLRK